MISANTVWVEPNTTRAPMNNVNFRKALAYGINPAHIVSSVYNGIVKAANPTGLLPTLNSYIDQSMVKQYGFSYNPTLAKQYLAKSGYNGRAITLEVPDGWTDWMAGAQVIASDLAAIGIKVTPAYPQFSARQNDLINGNYDLALDNNAALASTPWSYFQRVYQLPIAKQQTAQLNWERFNSPEGLGPGPAGGHHSAGRHRQAELHLQPAGGGLPPAAAADPGLVQRRLVPGQQPVLDQLPRERHEQPEHAGHVAELPRRHDQHLRLAGLKAGPACP